jgi:site-specific DNA-methyltransferase (adenine-specific)
MAVMSRYPDKWFELAVVDPPYGIGESNRKSYHPNATTIYKRGNWDDFIPSQEYFNELFRVSQHQIIWGYNYFPLPECSKPIVWDKCQPEGIDQAMFELAWNSNNKIQAKIFKRSPSADKNCISNGDKRKRVQKMRIHPTQKPVALYDWIFKNYAKPTDKILDTHLGSGSSRIAAHRAGLDFTGCEIDKDYFDAAEQRYRNFTAQLRLF